MSYICLRLNSFYWKFAVHQTNIKVDRTCPKCQNVIRGLNDYFRHVEKDHRFECTMCTLKFAYRLKFDEHMLQVQKLICLNPCVTNSQLCSSRLMLSKQGPPWPASTAWQLSSPCLSTMTTSAWSTPSTASATSSSPARCYLSSTESLFMAPAFLFSPDILLLTNASCVCWPSQLRPRRTNIKKWITSFSVKRKIVTLDLYPELSWRNTQNMCITSHWIIPSIRCV